MWLPRPGMLMSTTTIFYTGILFIHDQHNNLQLLVTEIYLEFYLDLNLMVDTIGYGTSQVQIRIHNFCTITVLLDKLIRLQNTVLILPC
jgi:hypothetical protein